MCKKDPNGGDEIAAPTGLPRGDLAAADYLPRSAVLRQDDAQLLTLGFRSTTISNCVRSSLTCAASMARCVRLIHASPLSVSSTVRCGTSCRNAARSRITSFATAASKTALSLVPAAAEGAGGVGRNETRRQKRSPSGQAAIARQANRCIRTHDSLRRPWNDDGLGALILINEPRPKATLKIVHGRYCSVHMA